MDRYVIDRLFLIKENFSFFFLQMIGRAIGLYWPVLLVMAPLVGGIVNPGELGSGN